MFILKLTRWVDAKMILRRIDISRVLAKGE